MSSVAAWPPPLLLLLLLLLLLAAVPLRGLPASAVVPHTAAAADKTVFCCCVPRCAPCSCRSGAALNAVTGSRGAHGCCRSAISPFNVAAGTRSGRRSPGAGTSLRSCATDAGAMDPFSAPFCGNADWTGCGVAFGCLRRALLRAAHCFAAAAACCAAASSSWNVQWHWGHANPSCTKRGKSWDWRLYLNTRRQCSTPGYFLDITKLVAIGKRSH